jgi:hypothetical protein
LTPKPVLRHEWTMKYILRDLILSPSSFAKPKEVDLAPTPQVNESVPVLPRLGSGPSIVAFLRHIGCPFAEATVRQMIELRAVHPDVSFVAVTHSPEQPSFAWCEQFGGPGSVRVLSDPERISYGAWGVGLTDRQHFAGRESIAAVRRLLAEGIHNRRASGSRWQGAATFAVGAGIVRWRHLPSHAGDLPPLIDAVNTLVPFTE